MWSFLRTIILSILIIVIIHFLFHYIKDSLTPKKRKDVISYEINKYKDIVENLIEKNKENLEETHKYNYNQTNEEQLLEETLKTYNISQDHNNYENKNRSKTKPDDDTESVVDFNNMERELTDYINDIQLQ